MTEHESPILFSVDLQDCAALSRLRATEICAAFSAALERAGANVEQRSTHVFPGAGLTSVLILRESHAVIHTWPETGVVNLDIFSCTTRLRTMEAVDELSDFLGAGRISVRATPRADGHGPKADSPR